MNLLPCGDRALLLDCADDAEARRWHAALAPVADATRGARTVLLRGEPRELRALIARTTPSPENPAGSGRVVRIPTSYDGADLPEVADHTGLSADEIVTAHTSTPWRVAFAGFAPGFAYLTGGDPRLVVPRRPTPRTQVPAGAVALAGPYSGIYPRASPGGWQLIGRTDVALWDLAREQPALLQPGDSVHFEAVR